MFDPQALTDFLAELALNNNKPWFDQHRERYQKLRIALLQFSESVHADLVQIDPSLAHMNPKKCLFRINRDIRFSRNKRPYKTYLGAKFSNDGGSHNFAAYNLIFTAEGELLLMAGIPKPTTPKLNKVRDFIVTKKDLQTIVHDKSFQKKFELYAIDKLKTCPKGYDKNSPDLELLQLKNWWVMHIITTKIWSQWSEKKLHDYCVKTLAELTPFVSTLNQALYTEN